MALMDPMKGPPLDGGPSSSEGSDLGGAELHMKAMHKAMANGNWSKAVQSYKALKLACESEGYEAPEEE